MKIAHTPNAGLIIFVINFGLLAAFIGTWFWIYALGGRLGVISAAILYLGGWLLMKFPSISNYSTWLIVIGIIMGLVSFKEKPKISNI